MHDIQGRCQICGGDGFHKSNCRVNIMMTLCLECGAYVSPEYADEHHGLCMACAHRTRSSMIDVTSLHSGNRREYAPGLIDHDMAQPSTSDPIADAIDRAWGEYYRDVGGDS